MSLPFHNARLVKVTAGGFSSNYGQPPTAGEAKWTGDEPALLRDRVRDVASDGNVDRLVEAALTVPLLCDVDITAGDVVHLDDGAARTVATVVADDALGEIRMILETT